MYKKKKSHFRTGFWEERRQNTFLKFVFSFESHSSSSSTESLFFESVDEIESREVGWSSEKLTTRVRVRVPSESSESTIVKQVIKRSHADKGWRKQNTLNFDVELWQQSKCNKNNLIRSPRMQKKSSNLKRKEMLSEETWTWNNTQTDNVFSLCSLSDNKQRRDDTQLLHQLK